MRKRTALVALLLMTLPISPLRASESTPSTVVGDAPSDPEPRGTYWLRNREGWFWYRDPPQPLPAPKASAAPPHRPQTLVEIEPMQRRLEDLKRIAVMNPSDTNLLAYMRYQRYVMNKSEVFAERWQRLVWTVPELDYGLTGRPT